MEKGNFERHKKICENINVESKQTKDLKEMVKKDFKELLYTDMNINVQGVELNEAYKILLSEITEKKILKMVKVVYEELVKESEEIN